MSDSTFALPASRRLALSASLQLGRWATRHQQEQLRREAQAYEEAREAQARFALDALEATLLR